MYILYIACFCQKVKSLLCKQVIIRVVQCNLENNRNDATVIYGYKKTKLKLCNCVENSQTRNEPQTMICEQGCYILYMKEFCDKDWRLIKKRMISGKHKGNLGMPLLTSACCVSVSC